MRKALIGILLAATVMSPAIARGGQAGGLQDADRAQQQRSDRTPTQEQRVRRGQAQAQAMGARQQAAAAQAAQAQRGPAARSAQASQAQRRGDARRQGAGGQNLSIAQDSRGREVRGRDGRGQGSGYRQRIEETREASRRSAEGLSPRYQQRAAENQRAYERDLRDARITRGNERRVETRDGRRDDRWRDGRGRDDRAGNRRWTDNRGNGWNNGWRNDNRYDWQRYRYSNRNVFRPGRYYAPYRNYNYQRFYAGSLLDSVFFGSRYWLSDPYQYRLPPAPYGTRWVRYYDDVMLVDTYSGQVVDVIHDFFW